ncbi:DUF2157 domain-containing protein [Candidatus Avelusimicrobium luingense]|uniref:DUF2157 domain-containing protein n=1 Tax=Candidatus Avelusimicrobium luingense TaxID=3416211 RepID=UPI003D0D25AC
MSIAKKIKTWQENKFLSEQQAEQILAFERARGNRTFWGTAFIFAGLLIGLGICLIVASNWDALGAPVKLTGDFLLLGGFSYAVYWSICQKRSGLKELFIVIAFLLSGASIGLIAQVFQLDGGWQSFAVFWSLLGLVYVWASRVLFIGMSWWILLLSGVLKGKWLESLFEYLGKHLDATALALIAGLWLLSYAGGKANEKLSVYTRLAAAFEKVMMWCTYATVAFVGIRWGMIRWENTFFLQCFAYLIVFAFLGARMYLAVQTQNRISFKRNAILAEVYVFGIFASRFGNLLASGFGFIIGGLLVLGLIYVLRRTTRYIKSMEAFQ